MKSANRKYDALQQGQLTLRQLGDKVERLFHLFYGVVNPREAEIQKITKFLGALNNPDIHRFVELLPQLVQFRLHSFQGKSLEVHPLRDGIHSSGSYAFLASGLFWCTVSLCMLHSLDKSDGSAEQNKYMNFWIVKSSQKFGDLLYLVFSRIENPVRKVEKSLYFVTKLSQRQLTLL